MKSKMLLICEKCTLKSINDEIKNAPIKIRKEINQICKSENNISCRAVNTSCFKLCPEDKIGVIMADKDNPEFFSEFTISTKTTGIELYEKYFKKKLNGSLTEDFISWNNIYERKNDFFFH